MGRSSDCPFLLVVYSPIFVSLFIFPLFEWIVCFWVDPRVCLFWGGQQQLCSESCFTLNWWVRLAFVFCIFVLNVALLHDCPQAVGTVWHMWPFVLSEWLKFFPSPHQRRLEGDCCWVCSLLELWWEAHVNLRPLGGSVVFYNCKGPCLIGHICCCGCMEHCFSHYRHRQPLKVHSIALKKIFDQKLGS